jgi:hypothetical protein
VYHCRTVHGEEKLTFILVSCRLVREEIFGKRRMLMSMDQESMPLSANGGMSMPFSANGGMSMSFGADMSMPIDADMSLPFDAGFSMPIDAGFSMPIDADMSMPETLPADDSATSVTGDPCDKGSNPWFTLSEAFEVTPSKDESPDTLLLNVLTEEIPKDFEVCSSVARQLWEAERKMEEYVLGIEIDNVDVDENKSCSSGAENCEIVNASFDVIHKDGTSRTDATDEFLGKLAARLANVNEVKLADDSSQPDSSTSTSGTEAGQSGGLGRGKTAAAVVGSLAVVAVALVLLQRKIVKKRSDDLSLDGSASTSTPYNSSLPIS